MTSTHPGRVGALCVEYELQGVGLGTHFSTDLLGFWTKAFHPDLSFQISEMGPMIRVTRERHCRPSSSSEALRAPPDPDPCGAVCLPGLSQALEPRPSLQHFRQAFT